MPSKSDMIGAIMFYCRKNNIHISYLYKSSKKELEDFIIKYNINVEELLFELAKERESCKIATQESEAKLIDAINRIKDEREMLISLLTDEQKEKFFEYCDSQKSSSL